MPSGFARGSASHKAILIAPPNGDRDHSSLRGWLQEEGLGVETRGGSAAVRCSDPDLIILIHDPPRFDGMAVLRRVISRSADHVLVAIVVSDSRPVSAEESLGLAHMDLLPSRPGRDAFRNSVESALRMRRRLVELEDRADRDGLTGLANRHALERRLAMECLRHRESGEPLTLLMADLDLFKQVNDRHGHLVGDELLRGVAAEFLRSVRESDFVARYGGEALVILAPDCDAICGEVLAERTRRRIAELPLAELRLEHPVTLSLGAVTADSRQDMVPDLLLYRADHALYEAKTAGRNAVRIWSELTHPTLSR